jgi:cytochrome b561
VAVPENDERERTEDDEGASVARLAIYAVTIFMLIAGLLGLVTGSFTVEHFQPTVPPTSNPITVP